MTGRAPYVVASGVTAIGGRPHAETEALAEAGALACGATAYVTLEPCAHPDARRLVPRRWCQPASPASVGAATDPDGRVSGRGYAILRRAGIAVTEGVCRDAAADQHARLSDSIDEKAPGSGL